MTAREMAVAFILENPGCRPVDIALHVCPKTKRIGGWSPQTAAMWVGQLLRPRLQDRTIKRRLLNGVVFGYFPGSKIP